MQYLFLLIGIIIGITIGIIISSLSEAAGVLRIDKTGEKDMYRFEIDDIDILSKKRRLVLKIDSSADLREKNM